MAKVRNTFAKHQREQEKRHKADQKRIRRAKKGQETEALDEPQQPPVPLSATEESPENE